MTFSKNIFIPVLIFTVIVINTGFLVYSNGINNFHYSLDDPYIHLEIANNIVEHSNYGINSNEFTSPSSSPLWTILIALSIKIFGNNELIPLYLNILFALLAIFVLNRLNDSIYYKILLTFALLVASIPGLIVNGMEHTLHISLFVFLFFKINSNLESKSSNLSPTIIILTFLLPLIRYEYIFFSFIISSILIFKKNYKEAITLGMISLIGIFVFGFFAVSNGGTFIPTSILLKSDIDSNSLFQIIHRFGYKWILNLSGTPELILILFSMIILYAVNRSTKYKFHILSYSFLLLFHSYFAKFGWLYRYEAYLIITGLVIIILNLIENKSILKNIGKTLALVLFFVFSIIFVYRMVEVNTESKKAISKLNIQQYQMAKFVKQYYNSKSVACNDIGAIAYYSDSYIIDLFGLGNNAVTYAKINKLPLQKVYINELESNNCELIIIYKNWFVGPNSLPDGYIEICDWTSQIPIHIGEDTVTFLTTAENKEKLKQELIDFLSLNFQNNPPFKVEYYD